MEGYYDWNFKYSAGRYDKLRTVMRLMPIILTGDSLKIKKTNIQFGVYFKPMIETVNIIITHCFICAN